MLNKLASRERLYLAPDEMGQRRVLPPPSLGKSLIIDNGIITASDKRIKRRRVSELLLCCGNYDPVGEENLTSVSIP